MTSRRTPFVVLLTATVAPRRMIQVSLADPGEREKHYIRSIEFLLGTPSDLIESVVFVENSGWPLDRVRESARRANVHRRNVEFLSFEFNDECAPFGKGHAEFRMVDAAQGSSLISRASYFVKLTGRLTVRNLHGILRHLPPVFDLAADAYHPGLRRRTGVVDTRLVAFSRRFYSEQVRGCYTRMDDSDGRDAEHVLYDVVAASAGANLVANLPREPIWVGVSASNGVDYGRSSHRGRPLKVLRRHLRRLRALLS